MSCLSCVAIMLIMYASASVIVPPFCLQTECKPASNKTNATCYGYLPYTTYIIENYYFTVSDFYYTNVNNHNQYCPINNALFPNHTLNYVNKTANGGVCKYNMDCLSTYCNSSNCCTKLGARGDKCGTTSDCALSFQCTSGFCQEGRPIGINCRTPTDCDIITSYCYQGVCTAYFSLPATSVLNSSDTSLNQQFLCEEAIAINFICQSRKNLPQLDYTKGKKYKLCSSDVDCSYKNGSPVDLVVKCRCMPDSVASGGQGYCVYGGGEKELIQTYQLMKKIYYKQPIEVIKGLMTFTTREGHAEYENPAPCSLSNLLKNSGVEHVASVLSVVVLLLIAL